jgi:SAM-dependent methyltransferase
MDSPRNLAPSRFWDDDYLAGIDLPERPSEDYPYERALSAALTEHAPAAAGQTVLEIGCAPGRWLVWYGERFGAEVVGLERSTKGAVMTRANLEAAGLDGAVVEGDFFDAALDVPAADLVVSFGFIEHFDDLWAAFERHLDFVKPGGRLVIGVPNFRGLTGLFQRWGDPEFLAMHNREAMRPQLYEEFAARADVEVETIRYLDSFDPHMIRVTRHGPAVFLLPLTALRELRAMDRVNSRAFSSYLLTVFRRPAST